MTQDPLVETLTLKGALLVADSTTYDAGDMHRIALKVLAHEYRLLENDIAEARGMIETLDCSNDRLRNKLAGRRA